MASQLGKRQRTAAGSRKPKPTSLRVSEYRQRQKQRGIVHLSLMVPVADVAFFREMARNARLNRMAMPSRAASNARPEKKSLTDRQMKQAQRWAVRSGLRLRLTGLGLKLGYLLARNIAHEIARSGWPIGHNLGSEAALMERYAVSRSILREAIRLLEYQSVAAMRRGVSGGLIVTEPDLAAVAYAAGIYLQARHFRAADLIATRKMLELHILERCSRRLNERSRERLAQALAFEKTLNARASGADLQRFHIALATIAGDPACFMFLDTLLRTCRFYTNYYRRSAERERAVAEIKRAHAFIARCLMQGDLQGAGRAMTRYLDHVGKSFDQ